MLLLFNSCMVWLFRYCAKWHLLPVKLVCTAGILSSCFCFSKSIQESSPPSLFQAKYTKLLKRYVSVKALHTWQNNTINWLSSTPKAQIVLPATWEKLHPLCLKQAEWSWFVHKGPNKPQTTLSWIKKARWAPSSVLTLIGITEYYPYPWKAALWPSCAA